MGLLDIDITQFEPTAPSLGGGPRPSDAQPNTVVRNPDGSFSREKTITVGIDNRFFNIPTLVNGRQLTGEQAIAEAEKVGVSRFPSFGTMAEAVAAASNRRRAIGIAGARAAPLNLDIGTLGGAGGALPRATDPVSALEQDPQLDLASILAQSAEAAKPIIDQLIPLPEPVSPARRSSIRRAALLGALAGQKAANNAGIQESRRLAEERKSIIERRRDAQVRLTGDLARDTINAARAKEAKREAKKTQMEKEVRAVKEKIASSGVISPEEAADLPDDLDELLPILNDAARATKDENQRHDIHTLAIRNGVILSTMDAQDREDALAFRPPEGEGPDAIEVELKAQRLKNAQLDEQIKERNLVEASADALGKLKGIRRQQREIEAVFIRELSGFFSGDKTWADVVASDFKDIDRSKRLDNPLPGDPGKKLTFGNLIETYKNNVVSQAFLESELRKVGVETEGEFVDPSVVDQEFEDALNAAEAELVPINSATGEVATGEPGTPEAAAASAPAPTGAPVPSNATSGTEISLSGPASGTDAVLQRLGEGIESILSLLQPKAEEFDERFDRTKKSILGAVGGRRRDEGFVGPRREGRDQGGKKRDILGPDAKKIIDAIMSLRTPRAGRR